jgi:hypothetical protein
VKTLNRALFEAGIFVMRDSETGKRYGRRDDQGRIIEAYGFDLSPLAYRCEEFIRIAAEAQAERARMGNLRKRATCAGVPSYRLAKPSPPSVPCPLNGGPWRSSMARVHSCPSFVLLSPMAGPCFIECM